MTRLCRSPALATLLSLCLLTSQSVWAIGNTIQLPDMGDSESAVLPPAKADEIGRETMRQIRAIDYLYTDPEIDAYIQRIGRSIARQTDRPLNRFHFFVVRDKQINAFALPGGYVGVNLGLILATRDENELAGVMAHEIAHVVQHHIARQIEASGKFQIATVAALLVAILAGASNPNVVQAAVSLGLGISGQQRINFTRAHEQEADRVGIGLMDKAGYDPNGMADFFGYMQERARIYGDQFPEILQSHPVNSTRIAEARARIAHLTIPPPHDQSEYLLMRARLRVLTAAQSEDARAYFTPENSVPEPARSYALALVDYLTSHFDKALAVQQSQLEKSPDNVHLAMALARTQIAMGDNKAALQVMQQSAANHPAYLPLTLLRADTYIQSGQAQVARDLLQAPSVLATNDAEVHRLLGQAALKLGQKPEAHYQMALYHLNIDEFGAAMNQVRAGLHMEGLKPADKARLQALKTQIDKAWPKKDRRDYNASWASIQ